MIVTHARLLQCGTNHLESTLEFAVVTGEKVVYNEIEKRMKREGQ